MRWRGIRCWYLEAAFWLDRSAQVGQSGACGIGGDGSVLQIFIPRVFDNQQALQLIGEGYAAGDLHGTVQGYKAQRLSFE